MIKRLKDLLTVARSASGSGEEKDAGHDVMVATCALLLEMAHIDGEFSEDEKARIISILKSKYRLTEEYVTALMVAARDELNRSLDYWQFAHLINENYTDQEKKEIVELAWRIVYVDGRMDAHEDYLMHKLAKLLRVSHKEFIDAKVKAKRGSSTG